ncbi:MAG: endonuclease [Bacteroidota bacterium]
MKFLSSTILAIFFAFPSFLSAQTPPPGLENAALRSWIKSNFYDGEHNQLGYTIARRRMFNYIDNQNDTVYCVYGGLAKYVPFGGTTTYPAPLNTEHTVPQAFFSQNEPMRSDIHHLFPTYENWNSVRASDPFAEINDSQTIQWMRLNQSQSNIPGNLIEEYSESNGNAYEAREDHKGDAARAIFYFFTMYPTQAGNISQLGNINTLYQWHQQDPPDAKEISRNDGIETYQGNRNPYVDHPDWVGPAWGFGVPGPDMPTGLVVSSDTNRLNLQWDDLPTENGYLIYRSTDNQNFAFLDSLAEDVVTYADSDVQGGLTYYYYVIAYNAAGNSLPSSVASGSPIPGMNSGGFAAELLFSEYVEGDLFNKALEIANGTGQFVNLSAYSLKKQLNGSGPWTDELVLQGNLLDGDVWVVASEAASSEIVAQADVTTNSNLMLFNGNDPIGLFKNDSLIDVIGEFDGGGISFGGEVTLRRKTWVVAPSATYQVNEWEVLAANTIDGLGVHSFDPSSNSRTNLLPADVWQVWPNPTEELIWVETKGIQQVELTLFNEMGQQMQAPTIQTQGGRWQVSLAHLPAGIYLLNVMTETQSGSTRIAKF